MDLHSTLNTLLTVTLSCDTSLRQPEYMFPVVDSFFEVNISDNSATRL